MACDAPCRLQGPGLAGARGLACVAGATASAWSAPGPPCPDVGPVQSVPGEARFYWMPPGAPRMSWPLANEAARAYTFRRPLLDGTHEEIVGQLAVVESQAQNDVVQAVAGGRAVWLAAGAIEVPQGGSASKYSWAAYPLFNVSFSRTSLGFSNFIPSYGARPGRGLTMQPDGKWYCAFLRASRLYTPWLIP